MVQLPMSGQTMQNRQGLPAPAFKGDKLLQIVNVANLYNQPIREYMIQSKLNQEFNIAEVEDLARRYLDFKIGESIYDYTDMLIMAKNADLDIPELKYLFIDEAQDLSTLQWILVNRLASKAEHIVITGDDKQAINMFAGADVDTFLSLPGKVETLQESHRVPKAVYNLANKIMTKMIKYRKEGATWAPKDKQGQVIRCTSIPFLKLVSGEWLILARTSHQLEKIRDTLLHMSEDIPIVFTVNSAPPVDSELFRVKELLDLIQKTGIKGIQKFLKIDTNDSHTILTTKKEYIKLFKKYCSCSPKLTEYEIDTEFQLKLLRPWTECMDKVDPSTRRFVQNLSKVYKENGDKIFRDAKIKLMTIHAAKGREADNVIVCTDVPKNVKREIKERTSDTEAKIIYVAVTRAKEKLYIYSTDSKDGTLKDYL